MLGEPVPAVIAGDDDPRPDQLANPIAEDARRHPLAAVLQCPEAERLVAHLPQDPQRPPSPEQVERHEQWPARRRAARRTAWNGVALRNQNHYVCFDFRSTLPKGPRVNHFHDHLLAGDIDGAVGRLAPDAVFHSPVADYHGRHRIAKVYTALSRVLGHAHVTSVLRGDRETAVAFQGSVMGRDVDGMLRVVTNPDGTVGHVTLLLRPLDVLLAGVERMKALLGGPD